MKRQEFLNKLALMSDLEFEDMVKKFEYGGDIQSPKTEEVQNMETLPEKSVTLHKNGGSVIDQLKSQLPDSDIIDLLQSFGIDELLKGGNKSTKNMSIQIIISGSDEDEEENDGGHKVPELGLIEVGDKTYKIETVSTDADMEQGLGGRDSLDPDMGMLFDFGEVLEEVQFNTKDMKFPIDIVFIGDDEEVIKIAKECEPGNDIFTCSNVRYVLEVNAGSGIKKGDDVDITDCPDNKTPDMKVLAPDGSAQMVLKGGERIMSRHDTKSLIKWAKRAEASKDDSDYKTLGNRLFKYLRIQDSNTPEYVSLPEE